MNTLISHTKYQSTFPAVRNRHTDVLFSVSEYISCIVEYNDNDKDNESDFIATSYINHITRYIQARLSERK